MPLPAFSETKLDELKASVNAQAEIVSTTLQPVEIGTISEEEAKQLHIFAQNKEQYELMLESQRIATVQKEHDALHQPYTEECPICLEDIRVTSSKSFILFSCCGKGMCRECYQRDPSYWADRTKSCPMCRTPIRSDPLDIKLREDAKSGKAWAQHLVGRHYLEGTKGFYMNKKKGVEFIELAAEQGYSLAMHQLGGMHYTGDGKVQSFSKARELFQKSADMGYCKAQECLAEMYFLGKGGEKNGKKSVKYATLAYASGCSIMASGLLGLDYLEGNGGLNKSFYRAKYYLEETTETGENGPLYYMKLSEALIGLEQEIYGMHPIHSRSFIPRIVFWARKAVASGLDGAGPEKLARGLEDKAKQFCHNCGVKAENLDYDLKKCVKCKSAWYCGKDCQVSHWKKGHKIDCVELL